MLKSDEGTSGIERPKSSIDLVVGHSDDELATVELLLMENVEGFLGVFAGLHLDESAPFGPARLTINEDFGADRLEATGVDELHEGLFVNLEVQVGQVDHGVLIQVDSFGPSLVLTMAVIGSTRVVGATASEGELFLVVAVVSLRLAVMTSKLRLVVKRSILVEAVEASSVSSGPSIAIAAASAVVTIVSSFAIAVTTVVAAGTASVAASATTFAVVSSRVATIATSWASSVVSTRKATTECVIWLQVRQVLDSGASEVNSSGVAFFEVLVVLHEAFSIDGSEVEADTGSISKRAH